MKFKKLWGVVKREWPLELSATIFLVAAFLLLTTKLRTLLGGFSAAELQTEAITDSFPGLVENILYWPYYLGVYLVRFIIEDAVSAARLTSAMLGFLAVISVLLIIRRWFNTQLAIVGSTVFLTGSWFLGLARLGTPEISGIAILLGLYVSVLWLINSPRKLLPSLAVILTTAFAWFVPFLPWLMVLGLAFAFVRERALIKIAPIWFWGLLSAVSLSALVAIGFGFSSNYDQTSQIFGIPGSIPTPSNMLEALRSTLAAIFWFAPTRPQSWLGNLPLLDIFGVVMVTLGVYHFERHFGNRRSLIVFGSLLIISCLLILNGGIESYGFTLLLPIIALLIVSGIHEYLSLWTRVFPRNPLAKLLAVAAMTLLVTTSSYYQLNRYFIAWPGAPETQEIYSANL